MDCEALLDSVEGIVWEFDPTTKRCRYVNRQAERLLGYPLEQWLKEDGVWPRCIHPEDHDWVVESCREQREVGHPFELEYRMVAADDRVVWLRDICTVTFEGGRATSSHGVMVDVTEQRLAEEAHRVTSERLTTILAEAPIVLFALDRDGFFTFCEGRALRAVGLKPSDMVGRSGSEAFLNIQGGAQIQANLQRALAGEEFTDLERAEGGAFETRYRTLRDAAGEPDGVIGVVVDVSDRVRAEDDRLAFEAQMQHTQKRESLGLLSGGLAHHFNNLLMTVAGNAELAVANIPPDSQGSSIAARLERIQRAARTGADLTHRLLAYAGAGEFEPHLLGLSALVRDTESLLRVSISKRAQLDFDLPAELPSVEADTAQLTQLILNLTSNAAEALGDASGVVTLRTGLFDAARDSLGQGFFGEPPEEGRFVFLEVSDTGAGMDAETSARIFDPFFTTRSVGRGLGLATSLGIVRRHGGFVRVDSQPGQGTSVRVLLPCAEDRSGSRVGAPQEELLTSGQGVVLVVDDEPDICEIARMMFEGLGFPVQVASRGSEALAWARAHQGPIAAAFIDFTMPEMSGDEVARELRQLRPTVPIVLMSGFLESQARSRLSEELDFAFLGKPFNLDDLARMLRDLVAPR
jgi:PAS domain S-box-containing protein